MANVNDELLANQLTDEAFKMCEDNGIRLSEHAGRLIRLAAEAIIKEPPRSSNAIFSGDEYGPGSEYWLRTGKDVFREVLENPLIKKEIRDRQEVSFPTILRAMADAGHRFLSSIGFKS